MGGQLSSRLFNGTKFWALMLLFFLLTAVAGATPAESFQDLMDKAKEAQLAGKTEQAADLYKAALRLQPRSGAAEYGLGLMASVQKNYQEASELLSRALRDDPSLVGAYLFHGIALFNLQKPDQALPSLEKFYRLRPNDPEVRFFLGGTYNALGNYSKAAEYYAAQLELTPERTEVWYFLGQCLLNLARRVKANLLSEQQGDYRLLLLDAQAKAEKGEVAVAEKDFREAIKTDPSSPEGYVNLGNLLLAAGKHTEAKEQFQEALQRSPQNCRALEGLGDTELAMGNVPASIAEYAKVAAAKEACIEEPVPSNLGLSPAEFGARLKALSAYADSEKWKLAVALERARLKSPVLGAEDGGAVESISRQPGRDSSKVAGDLQPCHSAVPRREWLSGPGADLFLANCQENRGDLRGAIQALTAVETRSKSDLEAAYWIFRLYMRLAQRVFVELASRAPDSYLLSEVRAESLELQGREAEAEKEYRIAIASSGSDPIPFIEFGRFKCKRNEFDEAITILKDALARAPYDTRVNDLMGEALFMKGEHATAIPYLQHGISVDPGNENSRIRLSQSLAKLGRIKEAILILEAAPSDREGRIHYVLAGYYRQEGKKEEMQRALAFFETRQKALKTKVLEKTN
jgi:tetratricopeptide (TPR) repeat protein